MQNQENIGQETLSKTSAPERWGVYIHIPFCRQKCFYCDFPSFAGKDKFQEAYIEALCREIRQQGLFYRQQWGKPSTIYIGGGTPSILSEILLEQLLTTIAETLDLRSAPPLGELSPTATEGVPPQGRPEFTVECNPGTLTLSKLQILRRLGVNRISIGVQSFDDVLLHRIGRIHTGAQAVKAVQAARAAGFANVSLDLMYGLPGQSLDDLRNSMAQTFALAPDHISIYGLQLEAGTAFARMQEMGRLHLPDEDTVEAMYDLMTHELPAHGYARYEISNFAHLGFESRHNLGYWHGVPYLGLGAAAHSYLGGVRYENTADIETYISSIKEGKLPRAVEEPATRTIQMEEAAFLALRTAKGISRTRFAHRFGVTLDSIYAPVIKKLVQQGVLADEGENVHLTAKGAKYGKLVFEAFLLD